MNKGSVLIVILLLAVSGWTGDGYKLPPKEIVDILDAPQPPMAIVSPDGRMILLAVPEEMPSIRELAEPVLKLAGIRFSPIYRVRIPMRAYVAATLLDTRSGNEQPIELPKGTRILNPSWSPDGRRLAFLTPEPQGTRLWLVDAAAPKPRRIDSLFVNALFGRGYTWMPGGRSLLLLALPPDPGPAQALSTVPDGPNVQETSGKVSRVATFQDLLRNTADEASFAYHAASQLTRIDADDGRTELIGEPEFFLSVDPSPDGEYLLIERLKRPFSYAVPYFYFPQTVEVWTKKGKRIKVAADLPLADEIPMNGERVGPRDVHWQPLAAPATLVWAEALDNGDPERTVPFRDRLVRLPAPFAGNGEEVTRTVQRFAGIDWLETRGTALLSEYDWKKDWQTTYRVDFNVQADKPRRIFSYNVNDGYGDPGNPVRRSLPDGTSVVRETAGSIFLAGNGASPEGDRPFLDRLDLTSGKKKRLFWCASGKYQSFAAFVGSDQKRIIVRNETKMEPPNLFLHDLGRKGMKQLTFYRDPAPQLTRIEKKLISYKRSDGVLLSGLLYLPAGYQAGTRLPLIIWAYPREFTDAGTAGQVRGSEHRFTFFRGASQLFFLTQGYAVLDNAQMPVVGDPKTKNNTFIQQIVESARSAIDTLDAIGIVDRRRVGVGGHSYGAFMTANLLVHCDLFAAGVARSGAYNRSLTPFGFQNERRSFWEAPEIYMYVSPFAHANRIKAPILLIHGEHDNNQGTFPMQSERFYAALKGFGATARLVLLPLESHGYSARESVLHTLAEMIEWFDRFVKNRN